MAIIISDASPLFALDHLGQMDLLRLYYGEVLVPVAVTEEVRLPRPPRKGIELSRYPYLVPARPKNPAVVAMLRKDLGAGESEAIAIALEVISEPWQPIRAASGAMAALSLLNDHT